MVRITALLAEGLRNIGCDVSTAPWGRHTYDETFAARVVRRPKDILELRQIVAAAGADCVVVQTSHDWPSIIRDLALVRAIRRASPRLVLQWHGSRANLVAGAGHRWLKLGTTFLLNAVDGALVLSSEELEIFRRFAPKSRFETVTNPFQPLPASDPPRRSVRGRAHSASLLFAGRLLPEKGIFDVLDALELLVDGSDVHLVVAGSGPVSDVKQRVAERHLSEHVTVAGYLDETHLATAYAAADVFVLPTYATEGFPTVIAEAMGAGLPIVTTRTRGISDHLEEGVNALFVAPRDPAALAVALQRLLDDHALRKLLARANRAAVEKFAPERVAKDYLAALSRIIA
jgi:glycosyltransferase involved in cell wall biosynthesis